jgi:ketosteroid isomerase-like protein
MSTTPDAAMRARREAKIQEHIAAENRRDSAATLATMHEAHYDVVPWGLVVDGRENVREFLEGYFTMMPAIHTEATRFYHADDALIVETRTVGTKARSKGSPRTAGRSR